MKKDNIYKRNKARGQVMLEFTFSMIVLLLMIYGVMMIMQWMGKSYVERRKDHDALLTGGGSPRDQIDPYFHKPIKMNAIWKGEINL